MEIFFILSIVSCIFLTVFFNHLIKDKKVIDIILLILSIVLFTWKCLEFGYYAYYNKGIYPVEFSHISYFIVSIIIIFSIKKLYFTAGLFSFISGVGYSLVAILSPTNMISSHSPTIVIFGVISHMMLFFIGYTLLFNHGKYYYKDFYIPTIILSLVFIYILLIQNGIIYPNLTNKNFVALKIASFQLLTYIGINNQTLNFAATIVIVFLLYSLIFVFTFINREIYKHRRNYI